MADNTRYKAEPDLTNTTYWSLGHVPAANENIFFLEGAETFTSGQDMSANNVASVYVGPNRGDLSSKFGAAGTPLRFKIDQTAAGKFRYFGNDGEMNVAGVSGGAQKIDIVEISPKNALLRYALSDFTATTRIVLDAASGTMANSISMSSATDIFVIGGDHIYEYKSGNVPNIYVMGGRIRVRGDWTAAVVGGSGVMIIELNSAVGAGGTLAQYGGTVIHEQGSLGAYTGLSGTLDQSGLKANATYASALRSSALRVLTPKTGATVTYTAAAVDMGRGPTVS